MTAKRQNFSLVCQPPGEGGLIAIGGYNNGNFLDVVECLHDEDATEWRRLAPLPLPLSSRSGAYFKQRILLAGGQKVGYANTADIHAFYPPTAGGLGKWVTLLPKLPRPEYPRQITICGNSLFLTGKYPLQFRLMFRSSKNRIWHLDCRAYFLLDDSPTPILYSFNVKMQASLEEKRVRVI